MNVDTGQFEALTDQVAELAEKVWCLEEAAQAGTGALEIVYEAGKDAARRELGLPAVHAPVTPRPRHLRTVRGKRDRRRSR